MLVNITLKNVPEDLHDQLKKFAQKDGRSMNRTAIMLLQEQLSVPSNQNSKLLQRIRERRDRLPVLLDEAFIEKAKAQGRK